MSENNLSIAYIKERNNSLQINLNLSLPNVIDLRKSQYLLVIQLNTRDFSKIVIYPIKKKSIIKIVLIGVDIKEEHIEILSEELQNFEIIHTSGLIQKGNETFYECYLNLNINDNKYKDLKTSLDTIKNIFNEIKIFEVGLQKI